MAPPKKLNKRIPTRKPNTITFPQNSPLRPQSRPTRSRKKKTAEANIIQVRGLTACQTSPCTARPKTPLDQFPVEGEDNCSRPVTSPAILQSPPGSEATTPQIEPHQPLTLEELELDRLTYLRKLVTQLDRGQGAPGYTIFLKTSPLSVLSTIANKYHLDSVSFEQNWNVGWTDAPMELEKVRCIQYFQVVNHFPAMSCIARKDLLAANMQRMSKLFPNDYNIFPRTFTLPEQFEEYEQYKQKNKKTIYIHKPDSGSKGVGIHLIRPDKQLNPFSRGICQVYIRKPFLLDGYKFDFRLFVLVTSIDPLRIFVHNHGISRFATVKYEDPISNPNAMLINRMHLTNYYVNQASVDYNKNETKGSKRSLFTVFGQLRKKGCNIKKLMQKIDDIIIKTIISGRPLLKETYDKCFANRKNACFEILGFDIILDHNFKPYLLEVNQAPSFSTYSDLDIFIKASVIDNTFDMLNIARLDFKLALDEAEERERNRLLQQASSANLQEKQSLTRTISSKISSTFKPKKKKKVDDQLMHEKSCCQYNGYRLLYPANNTFKYKKYFNQ